MCEGFQGRNGAHVEFGRAVVDGDEEVALAGANVRAWHELEDWKRPLILITPLIWRFEWTPGCSSSAAAAFDNA
jgi:hypothetical protein